MNEVQNTQSVMQKINVEWNAFFQKKQQEHDECNDGDSWRKEENHLVSERIFREILTASWSFLILAESVEDSLGPLKVVFEADFLSFRRGDSVNQQTVTSPLQTQTWSFYYVGWTGFIVIFNSDFRL